MLHFTVGPTEYSKDLYKIYKNKLRDYDERTGTFIIDSLNKGFSNILNTKNHKFLYLSMTGTSLMEVTLLNIFNEKDKVLVIDGGDFGARFCSILTRLNIKHDVVKINHFDTVKEEDLEKYDNKSYTALLVNMLETSTGVLYDMDLLANFAKKNNMLFVVDAISAFMAHPVDIDKYNIDACLVTSQKGLACMFGLSILGLSNKACQKILDNNPNTYSFDLKMYLKAMEGLKTPFTPTMNVILEVYYKLKEIEKLSMQYYYNDCLSKAKYFRDGLDKLGIKYYKDYQSNAVTVLEVSDSISLYNYLMDKKINIAASRKNYNNIVRVANYGYTTLKDYKKLLKYIEKWKNSIR